MPKPRRTENPFIQVALSAVEKIRNQLLLFCLAVDAMLIAFLLLAKAEIPHSLTPVIWGVVLLPIVVLVASGLAGKSTAERNPELSVDTDGQLAAQHPRVFPYSDSTEFVKQAEQLLTRAKRVVLIGTGLNILHRDPIRKSLMNRAASGNCQLEIYLANPFSPAVENRLVEEQLGETTPPVGRPGLIQRLDALLKERERLGCSSSIEIRLFSHYPTFALLIADSDYFVYPYGYATLGNFSPIIHFSGKHAADKGVITFLERQYDGIKLSSVEATFVRQISQVEAKKVPLLGFAVYFIPSQSSDLYKFGSEVLGYDVRKQFTTNSRWEGKAGSATEYGFHLTCCDALYFLNAQEAEFAAEQAAFLAKEFDPFDLEDLQVQAGFPDGNSISILATDPSGILEALHCELVPLIYRRAMASNYTSGKAALIRDKDLRRAELMTKRFKCPYIFKHFQPHFTLLNNVLPKDQETVVHQMRIEFEKSVRQRHVRVEKLAIMGKAEQDSCWHIVREISLL